MLLDSAVQVLFIGGRKPHKGLKSVGLANDRFGRHSQPECNVRSKALGQRTTLLQLQRTGVAGRREGCKNACVFPISGNMRCRFWRKTRRGGGSSAHPSKRVHLWLVGGRRKNNWRWKKKLASHRRPPSCLRRGLGRRKRETPVCRWGFGAGCHLFPRRSIRPPDAHARGGRGGREGGEFAHSEPAGATKAGDAFSPLHPPPPLSQRNSCQPPRLPSQGGLLCVFVCGQEAPPVLFHLFIFGPALALAPSDATTPLLLPPSHPIIPRCTKSMHRSEFRTAKRIWRCK